MKVLILSHSDVVGGAARAAYRLNKALQSIGVDSSMLVMIKTIDDPTVIPLYRGWRQKIVSLRYRVEDALSSKYVKNSKFSTAKFRNARLIRTVKRLSPDVLHLHWANGGMLSVEDLPKLKKPLVWTLHDMWLFSGGCHYSDGCIRYETQCGGCPVLNSQNHSDLSARVYQRKKEAFSKTNNLTVIGLSKWLQGAAKKSSLLEGRDVRNLPNPIDTNFFKPQVENTCRDSWGLPRDSKLVLFGAMHATSDLRKGFHELMQGLNLIESSVELVVFGNSAEEIETKSGFKIHYVGNISDDQRLVDLYNAVDLMVVPSLEENLSNAIMESLSCGTPVVAFDIGGNSDMIDHQSNGYLAKPKSPEDLAGGIDWILHHRDSQRLSKSSREKILGNFGEKIVAQEYLKLYHELT